MTPRAPMTEQRAIRPTKQPRRRAVGWLWAPLAICLLFLYIPIATVVVMSFNSGKSALNFSGFSLRWYPEFFRDSTLVDALLSSLAVALSAAAFATVVGTVLAVGLVRHARSTALDAFAMGPAIMPDLVLAIGLLAFFSVIGIPLGLQTIAIAHAVFGVAFVVAIVRSRVIQLDRSLEEASADLGAARFATFVRVTLPVIAPAVVAGALLSFTLSLDEFVIAFFTSGPSSTTLPIAIYSRVRFGVTPTINALATMLLGLTVTAVLIGAVVIRRSEGKK